MVLKTSEELTKEDNKMKLAIGGDHAGFDYKHSLYQELLTQGHKIEDFGTYSDGSVDYPDFAHPVASFVETNPDSIGILVCGSGNGVAMVANKHAGIRAAICWTKELAKLARQHNDANIICIPARFVFTSTGQRNDPYFFDGSL